MPVRRSQDEDRVQADDEMRHVLRPHVGSPFIAGVLGFKWGFWIFGILLVGWLTLFLSRAANAPRRNPARSLRDIAQPLRQPMSWILSLYYFLTFGGFVAMAPSGNQEKDCQLGSSTCHQLFCDLQLGLVSCSLRSLAAPSIPAHFLLSVQHFSHSTCQSVRSKWLLNEVCSFVQ